MLWHTKIYRSIVIEGTQRELVGGEQKFGYNLQWRLSFKQIRREDRSLFKNCGKFEYKGICGTERWSDLNGMRWRFFVVNGCRLCVLCCTEQQIEGKMKQFKQKIAQFLQKARQKTVPNRTNKPGTESNTEM